MTAVNYDDFCNEWRIYDRGHRPDDFGCEIKGRFTIACRGQKYFYSARSGFKGGMNDGNVPLTRVPTARGEYDGGEPLEGGLVGDFGEKGRIAFTLNEMAPGSFVISLSKVPADGATAQSHGGAHGVED